MYISSFRNPFYDVKISVFLSEFLMVNDHSRNEKKARIFGWHAAIERRSIVFKGRRALRTFDVPLLITRARKR